MEETLEVAQRSPILSELNRARACGSRDIHVTMNKDFVLLIEPARKLKYFVQIITAKSGMVTFRSPLSLHFTPAMQFPSPTLPCSLEVVRIDILHIKSDTAPICIFLPARGFPCDATTSLPPDISSPSHYSLNRSTRPIYSRSDVQIEDWFTARLRGCRVVIYYISYLPGLGIWCVPLNIPIMPVERWLTTISLISIQFPWFSNDFHSPVSRGVYPSHDLQHASLGGHILRPSHELQ